MSKAFEAWKKTTGTNGWTDAEAFAAGRALGRREMKGEAVRIIDSHHLPLGDLVADIEAIPEEI